jgi:hypothetical protein
VPSAPYAPVTATRRCEENAGGKRKIEYDTTERRLVVLQGEATPTMPEAHSRLTVLENEKVSLPSSIMGRLMPFRVVSWPLQKAMPSTFSIG